MSLPLTIMIAIAGANALWALLSPKRLLRFDMLCEVIMLAYLIPQAYRLEAEPYQEYDYHFTWWFVVVCQLMITLGFQAGGFLGNRRQKITKFEELTLDTRRLTRAAVAMLIVGLAGFFLTQRESLNQTGGAWSGVIIFYLMISQFMFNAGAVAWLLFLKIGNRIALAVFVVMCVMATLITLWWVRRAIILEAGFILIAGLYFVRRYVPPRAFLIAAVFVGFIVLNSTALLRGEAAAGRGVTNALVNGPALHTALGSDKIETDEASQSEMKLLVGDVEVARQSHEFTPFMSMWNAAASQYIPSFLLGRDLKNSFFIVPRGEVATRRYTDSNGLTRTGFSEAYGEYAEFGVLLFFLVGMIFGWMHRVAMQGSLMWQYVYMISMSLGLLIITESASRFLISIPILAFATWAPFAYAKVRLRIAPNRAAAGDPVWAGVASTSSPPTGDRE